MAIEAALNPRRAKSGILLAALGLAALAGCVAATGRLIVALPDAPARPADALAQSKSCIECHVDITKMFKGDKHVGKDFHCVLCHGPSEAHVDQDVEGAMPDRSWRRWSEEEERFIWRTKSAPLDIALFCAGCHGKTPPEGKATKAVDWNLFINSRHGRAVHAGSADAPTCTDCHWAHGVGAEERTDEDVVELCGGCHGFEEMMKRAGLNPGVVDAFKSGKHPPAPNVTPGKKTSCVDCHNPHGESHAARP